MPCKEYIHNVNGNRWVEVDTNGLIVGIFGVHRAKKSNWTSSLFCSCICVWLHASKHFNWYQCKSQNRYDLLFVSIKIDNKLCDASIIVIPTWLQAKRVKNGMECDRIWDLEVYILTRFKTFLDCVKRLHKYIWYVSTTESDKMVSSITALTIRRKFASACACTHTHVHFMYVLFIIVYIFQSAEKEWKMNKNK